MKPKSIIKKLQTLCEKLWKEVCFARDGRRCMVKVHFPELKEIKHSEVYQVDHCVTRDNKFLKFDPRNGTVVCSSCNASKSWNKKSVGRLIDMIVKEREGIEIFDWMVALDNSNLPNLEFTNIDWLEGWVEKLTKMKMEFTA